MFANAISALWDNYSPYFTIVGAQARNGVNSATIYDTTNWTEAQVKDPNFSPQPSWVATRGSVLEAIGYNPFVFFDYGGALYSVSCGQFSYLLVVSRYDSQHNEVVILSIDMKGDCSFVHQVTSSGVYLYFLSFPLDQPTKMDVMYMNPTTGQHNNPYQIDFTGSIIDKTVCAPTLDMDVLYMLCDNSTVAYNVSVPANPPSLLWDPIRFASISYACTKARGLSGSAWYETSSQTFHTVVGLQSPTSYYSTVVPNVNRCIFVSPTVLQYTVGTAIYTLNPTDPTSSPTLVFNSTCHLLPIGAMGSVTGVWMNQPDLQCSCTNGNNGQCIPGLKVLGPDWLVHDLKMNTSAPFIQHIPGDYSPSLLLQDRQSAYLRIPKNRSGVATCQGPFQQVPSDSVCIVDNRPVRCFYTFIAADAANAGCKTVFVIRNGNVPYLPPSILPLSIPLGVLDIPLGSVLVDTLNGSGQSLASLYLFIFVLVARFF
eukprot:TRINITY_DN260_c0_g1_i1.p1 TRINITY_DN260_c0_g1~~TRINITY_DN260_c0_g1_i1.p1  ORF type:complete len:561 (-),score=48.44 TRINITY_DN260_c0_g1_i1:120-1571(-)